MRLYSNNLKIHLLRKGISKHVFGNLIAGTSFKFYATDFE